MAEEKKGNMEKRTISICFGVIAAIMFLALLAYVSTFQSSIFSSENTDWGGFGDFFWGLGTMLLTGLNVYVFYKLTTILANQEKKHQEDFLHFEMLKMRLQKQQELIDNYCKAEVFTFSVVDDENGICIFDDKRIEAAMALYEGIEGYGEILATINDEKYRKTYNKLRLFYNVYRSEDEDNPYVEHWGENLYALHRSLRKQEEYLKNEHIATLANALHF